MPYGSYAHKQQYRNAAGRLTAQTGRIPDFCRYSGLPGQNKKTTVPDNPFFSFLDAEEKMIFFPDVK